MTSTVITVELSDIVVLKEQSRTIWKTAVHQISYVETRKRFGRDRGENELEQEPMPLLHWN
jgi:hypothetical protein